MATIPQPHASEKPTELCGAKSSTSSQRPKTFIPHKRFLGRGNGSSLFIPLAISRSPRLGFGAKLLYGRLCFHAGPDGECFPSETELCHELGILDRDGSIGPSQLRTLRNYLAELKAEKLILAEPRYNKRGERITNSYKFLESDSLKDCDTHRKKSSAGHRKEFSGKERKKSSAKVRKEFSAVKETSSSKEQSRKRNPGLKDEVEQTARIAESANSEAKSETPTQPKTKNLPPRKIDDDENPKPKTFPGEGDGHEQVSEPVAIVPLTANCPEFPGLEKTDKPDAWREILKLAPDISVADEQWIREQCELNGGPEALLELAKKNPPAGFAKGPVAGLKWLVKHLNRKSMSAAVHHATADALGIQRPQKPIELPKCPKCQNVGQLSETEFCDCAMGLQVKRAAEKVAADKALRKPAIEERGAAKAASA